MRFEDILQQYEIKYVTAGQHHHAREGWIQIDCPFCGINSGKFHMGYSLQGGYISCWVCGSHTLQSTLQELLNLNSSKVIEITKRISIKSLDIVKEKRGKLVLPKHITGLKTKHKNYLISRGFLPSTVKKTWHIKAISYSFRLAWRIFIPIHYKGEIVSWTTRSVTDKGLRYISASSDQEALNHKNLLYGEDLCRHSVCCVEGPFDVWRIGPGSVATCGTGFSRSQVLKLSKYPVRGVLFDNSKIAQTRADSLVNLLSVYPGNTFKIQLDSADDPAEADENEVKSIRKLLEL